LEVGLPALCNDGSQSAGNPSNASDKPIDIDGAIDNNITNEATRNNTELAPQDDDPRELLMMTDIKRNIVWTELMDSIQVFLLHDRISKPE
jgi:predicted nuclease of predicted toxin-antitoxin system